MKNICIFCGSRIGKDSRRGEMAFQIGRSLAEMGFGVVYGGASIGLMGKVADGALSIGGRVLGIIPDGILEKEIAHKGPIELKVVPNMGERKDLMIQESDAFLALPGGPGTLDELFEVMTLRQLQFHDNPNFVFNADGFFDPMLKQLDYMVDQGFMDEYRSELIHIYNSEKDLLEHLKKTLKA